MLMDNRIRTLFIDGDSGLIDDVKKYFSSSTVVDVCFTSTDGIEGLEMVKSHKNEIDLVVLDTLLPNKDGINLLREFKRIDANFKIVVTSSIKNTGVLNRIDNLNVGYIMLKPYNLEDLESIMKSVFESSRNIIRDGNLESKISKMLHSLGIPSHIKGYQYIRESVMLIYDNPYIIGGITKELYPEVANKYKTTSSRVERAIRHAIEVSWNRGDYEYMEELFGHSVDYDRAKPTNSEFIATVADKLRLEANTFSR